MKTYVKNIILYLVALLGLISFIALFSNPLKLYDSVNKTWNVYNVNAYVGEVIEGKRTYYGTIVPIFGFVIPLALAIAIIIESFKPSWLKKMRRINTIFAVLFFISAILVLLTKEMFINVNDFNDTSILKNGTGPIFSAVCSTIAGILLLVVTWIPSRTPVQFIEK